MTKTLALATRWLWQLTMLAYAAIAVGQPVLAGSYLSGNYDAISTHGRNGGLLMVVGFVAASVAALHWLMGRAKAWPVGVVAVLLALQIVQLVVGYSRNLAVHIPLGVGLIGTICWLTWWSFTASARRPGWFWRSRTARAGAPA